jgi:hypothetical protein
VSGELDYIIIYSYYYSGGILYKFYNLKNFFKFLFSVLTNFINFILYLNILQILSFIFNRNHISKTNFNVKYNF